MLPFILPKTDTETINGISHGAPLKVRAAQFYHNTYVKYLCKMIFKLSLIIGSFTTATASDEAISAGGTTAK